MDGRGEGLVQEAREVVERNGRTFGAEALPVGCKESKYLGGDTTVRRHRL